MVRVRQCGSGDEQIDENIVQNQTLHIQQGDDVLFDIALAQVDSFAKNGMDLEVLFKDSLKIQLANFFYIDRPNRESILTFKDGLFTATEIELCFEDELVNTIKPNQLVQHRKPGCEHVVLTSGRVQGGGKLTALEGSPFIYHFRLHEAFPENAKVSVLVNGKEMPSWLTLKKLAKQAYLLSGIPTRAVAGDMNLQIMIEVDDA